MSERDVCYGCGHERVEHGDDGCNSIAEVSYPDDGTHNSEVSWDEPCDCREFIEPNGEVRMPSCNQDGCEKPGAYRFTWPGHDEAHICEEHASWMRKIANAMGLHLQLIPLLTETKEEE